MKTILNGVVLSALVATFAAPALAQTATTPGLDKRESVQQGRIAEGIESGKLTPKEAARLEHGEAKLHQNEAKAKADGKVTPLERKKLNKQANRMSKRIHRQKHDAQTAPPATQP